MTKSSKVARGPHPLVKRDLYKQNVKDVQDGRKTTCSFRSKWKGTTNDDVNWKKYMDTHHNVEGLTAEAVAAAHAVNSSGMDRTFPIQIREEALNQTEEMA